MKPHVIDQKARERRQKAYLSVPSFDEQFPTVEELTIELQFNDPEGKVSPSPQNRIFVPGMQAFFDVQCPLRDCTGGFDLSDQVPRAVSARSNGNGGKVNCSGTRTRTGAKGADCGLELEFSVRAVRKDRRSKAAAAA